MAYLIRSQWHARLAKSRKPMARPVRTVYVHHSAGSAGKDHAATVRSIQNQHMDVQGWSDIAYHELVAPNGDVYEGRGLDWQGGATQGENATSVAWCLLGNFEREDPTPEAIDALAQRIANAAKVGRLSPGFVIRGHRDANATACPGSRLYALLPAIRQRVAHLLAPPPAPPQEDAAMFTVVKLHPGALGPGEAQDWIIPPNGPKYHCPDVGWSDGLREAGATFVDLTGDLSASKLVRDHQP